MNLLFIQKFRSAKVRVLLGETKRNTILILLIKYTGTINKKRRGVATSLLVVRQSGRMTRSIVYHAHRSEHSAFKGFKSRCETHDKTQHRFARHTLIRRKGSLDLVCEGFIENRFAVIQSSISYHRRFVSCNIHLQNGAAQQLLCQEAIFFN